MTKEIHLTRGQVALVDDADYEWLTVWHWHFLKGGYAVRSEMPGGVKRMVYMHRAIMDAPAGVQVDHINGIRLDNQRSNLRFCTNAQNAFNGGARGGSSVYRGVTFDKVHQKWVVRIKLSGRRYHVGLFLDELEAAHAFDDAARRLFGEFARTNFEATGKEITKRGK